MKKGSDKLRPHWRSTALPEVDRPAARKTFQQLTRYYSNDNQPKNIWARLKVLAYNRTLPLPVILVTLLSIAITAANAIAHN